MWIDKAFRAYFIYDFENFLQNLRLLFCKTMIFKFVVSLFLLLTLDNINAWRY